MDRRDTSAGEGGDSLVVCTGIGLERGGVLRGGIPVQPWHIITIMDATRKSDTIVVFMVIIGGVWMRQYAWSSEKLAAVNDLLFCAPISQPKSMLLPNLRVSLVATDSD